MEHGRKRVVSSSERPSIGTYSKASGANIQDIGTPVQSSVECIICVPALTAGLIGRLEYDNMRGKFRVRNTTSAMNLSDCVSGASLTTAIDGVSTRSDTSPRVGTSGRSKELEQEEAVGDSEGVSSFSVTLAGSQTVFRFVSS